MLARGGAAPLDVEPRSWSWLAFLIAGTCGALVLGAYAIRLRDPRPDPDRAESKSPSLLEIVATIVGICAGVAGLVTLFVPGVAARERPSPAATIAVRGVNPRVTRAEFARSIGDRRRLRRMRALDRREVGNVVWIQLRFIGYNGRELKLQWGSYDDTPGAGRPLIAATTPPGIRYRPKKDDVVAFQPVWVGYPGVQRYRVQFRLLERGEVREMASTGGMSGQVPRFECRRPT